MKKITCEYSYEILDRDELAFQEQEDLHWATRARDEAETKVSGFGVGAFIRMNDDETAQGWNLENNVHTTLHAEKNAMGRISDRGRKSGLKRVTVMGGPVGQESDVIVPPCGNCRQDLIELWKPCTDPMIIMAGTRGLITRIKLADLVPLLFDLDKYKSGKR
jgi:cytidine deaminase